MDDDEACRCPFCRAWAWMRGFWFGAIWFPARQTWRGLRRLWCQHDWREYISSHDWIGQKCKRCTASRIIPRPPPLHPNCRCVTVPVPYSPKPGGPIDKEPRCGTCKCWGRLLAGEGAGLCRGLRPPRAALETDRAGGCPEYVPA